MILIDANVIMYATGAEHLNKRPCLALMEQLATGALDAAIDVEALQEIMHRYRNLGRWETGGREAFDITCALFDTILPVTDRAAIVGSQLLDEHRAMTARDVIHAAVVLVNGLDGICSFDRDFDPVERVRRYVPGEQGDPIAVA